MSPKKILVLGSFDRSLLNFRGPLLRAMVQDGHAVVAAAPPETPGVSAKLAALGVRYAPVALARAGLNPLVDGMAFLRLLRLFRQERPEVVLGYTIKPVIYGSLAAAWAGVPRIYALITGLGAAFHSEGRKGRILRAVATRLYRLALARCRLVMVQNQEIADLFIKENIVPASKVVVMPGSGVNTGYFQTVPIPRGAPVFLLLGRMLRDKGVEEYVAAARFVREQRPDARFLLVGDTDPNPAAISVQQLEQWHREGVVEYRPAVTDVRPLLAQCTVYVLPSYHEGMPRSVLEAMATGRPVITTDTIGCKETVLNPGVADSEAIRTGENGVLVPVRSVRSLAAALLRLASDPELCARMGRRGREIAEQRFEVHQINRQMLLAMEVASEPPS